MTLYDSTDRRPGEYFLFALGFTGFILGAAGVIGNSIALAVLGCCFTLAALLAFMMS